MQYSRACCGQMLCDWVIPFCLQRPLCDSILVGISYICAEHFAGVLD